MHVIKTFCLFLLLYQSLSLALDFKQLEFDKSSCIFSFNGSLYLLGKADYTKVSFENDWSIGNPSISNYNHSGSQDTACTITKSGQLFLLQQNDCAIKNMSSSSFPWQTTIASTGSDNAIRRFNTDRPLESELMVAFNDFIYLFDRNDTVFVLDTVQLIWLEFKSSIPAPLFDSTSSALYSTSRWILWVRTDRQNTTLIDYFDPYTFHWLGTISTLNTTSIKAIPIRPFSLTDSDSLLLVPIRSSDTQSSAGTEADRYLWRLDIPTVDAAQITVTPIEQSLNSSISLVTLIADDLAMFYSGESNRNQKEFQFFNTTTLRFTHSPQWLSVQQPTSNSSISYLGVILGSVIGGTVFIVLLVLLFWYCLRRRRKLNQNRSIHQSRHVSLIPSKLIAPFKGSGHRDQQTEPVSVTDHSQTPYLLSPIQSSSPLHIFPHDPSSSSSIEKPGALKSKFKEHFDLGSIAEFESNSNLSVRILESPTTPNEKTASRNQLAHPP